jgi:hypothetical protein
MITDIVIGSLAASALRLIARKAILEPAAAWVGQAGLRQALRLAQRMLSKSPGNQDESRV